MAKAAKKTAPKKKAAPKDKSKSDRQGKLKGILPEPTEELIGLAEKYKADLSRWQRLGESLEEQREAILTRMGKQKLKNFKVGNVRFIDHIDPEKHKLKTQTEKSESD